MNLGNPLSVLNGYYPFGMVMPGRFHAPSNGYRYGFNGQDKENEITGSESHYSAEFWMYDSRLGRRWNIDPLFNEKPWMSSYHAFSNKPILHIDPNGANDTRYEDEMGNVIGETNDGSDDVVVMKKDKIDGFKSWWDATNEVNRDNPTMNEIWKEYSGNNIKSNQLDPKTLNQNLFTMNYPGGNNPMTYPDAKGKRKPVYSVPDKNLAGYPAMSHDKGYDNMGISGAWALFSDTRAISADWRFVGNEFWVGQTAISMGDYSTAFKAYTLGVLLGLAVTTKTMAQEFKANGIGPAENRMWNNVSKQ